MIGRMLLPADMFTLSAAEWAFTQPEVASPSQLFPQRYSVFAPCSSDPWRESLGFETHLLLVELLLTVRAPHGRWAPKRALERAP